MPRGHNERFYKFLIVDSNTDKKYYFRESSAIKEELGIKKGSLYNMLNSEDNTCFKYKDLYKAYKIRKPVYTEITIDYNEEFYNDEEDF